MNHHLIEACQEIRHILGLLVINHRGRGLIAVAALIRESITTWLAREAIPMSWLMKILQLHDQQSGLAEGAQCDISQQLQAASSPLLECLTLPLSGRQGATAFETSLTAAWPLEWLVRRCRV